MPTAPPYPARPAQNRPAALAAFPPLASWPLQTDAAGASRQTVLVSPSGFVILYPATPRRPSQRTARERSGRSSAALLPDRLLFPPDRTLPSWRMSSNGPGLPIQLSRLHAAPPRRPPQRSEGYPGALDGLHPPSRPKAAQLACLVERCRSPSGAFILHSATSRRSSQRAARGSRRVYRSPPSLAPCPLQTEGCPAGASRRAGRFLAISTFTQPPLGGHLNEWPEGHPGALAALPSLQLERCVAGASVQTVPVSPSGYLISTQLLLGGHCIGQLEGTRRSLRQDRSF